MKEFEEVMSKVKLKKPPEEAWQLYWASVYNRLERRVGWILLSIGAIILGFYGRRLCVFEASRPRPA